MTPTQAQQSIRNANAELFNLTPTAPITLFEIDASNLFYQDAVFDNYGGDKIFRFHNNVKLYNNNIIWQTKTYLAAPIQTEGFEYSAKGSLPTPKIAISVNESTVASLVNLKILLRNLNELVGAKVTRRRTYAMFLDADNWVLNGGPPNATYAPDPNSEFSPDIYYISRKSADNKSYLEFELTSIIDLDGLKLPGRLVLADRCMAVAYRGEGCLYEYGGSDGQSNRYDINVHKDGVLPSVAPPVANFKDETFAILLNIPNLTDKDQYSPTATYNIGDHFYVTKNYNKYYFVVKSPPPVNTPPPNDTYYYFDDCSRSIRGCKLRWNQFGQNGPNQGGLMFNGFPSVNKVG